MPDTRRLRLPVTALYFLLCNILFFLPGSALPKEDWLDRIWFDKWVHVGLFGLLSLLVAWTFGDPVRAHRLRALLWLAGYGLAVECIQGAFVPRRSFDLGDLLADTAGAALGLWLYGRFKFFRR